MATLQTLVERLPRLGERKAIGLRGELGLRWWSYRRLHQEAHRAAAVLAAAGVGPGDRVVLRAPSSPEWVGLLLGAMLRGAVLVPLDADASDEQVARITAEVEARQVVSGAGELAALFRSPPGGAGATAVAPVHPDAAALIYFTSGTTSTPRGVVLTHGNLMAQVERFRRWQGLVRLVGFRLMTLAPLSHIQGMVLGVCVPLWLGLAVIYTHSVHPAHLIRSLRDDRVTLLASVPRVLHVLGKALRQRPYGRSGATVDDKLRPARRRFVRRHYTFRAARAAFGYRFWVVFVGGAPLPAEDEQLWRDTGCFVVQGYGLTETAAIVSVNAPLFAPLGSIGRPLRHQEVRLAADGEVLVRGTSVTPGYYRDAAANQAAFAEDGFLRTGDLARRDRRNRLYFLGRKKEVIVTGEGFNVYPADVEARLHELPGVRDSVVLGLDRDGHAEIHAVLLLRPGASALETVRAANRQLQPYQHVRAWTVWPAPDFPRTSLLKPRRDEICRAVTAGRGDGAAVATAAGPPTLDEIRAAADHGRRLELLVEYVLAVGGAGGGGAGGAPPAGEALSLAADLGLSSLDMVELLARLEAGAEVSLDSAAVAADATVADLRALLAPDGGRARAARLPARPPAWWGTAVGDAVRAVVRPALAGAWAALSVRIAARFSSPLPAPPFVLAAAPHRHWLDVAAVHAALPRPLRRRLAFFTERDFHEYFDPAPGTPRRVRLHFAAAYYLLLPAVFRFAVLPSFGPTRAGLCEACRLLDLGYSPITFPKGFFFAPADAARHDLGAARIALECGVPVLPVWFEGNERLRMGPRPDRPQVTVHFGAAIPADSDLTPHQLAERVEAAFGELADGARRQRDPAAAPARGEGSR